MRCAKVQRAVEEAGEAQLSGPARRHLEACTACQNYAREFGRLTTGFRLLGQENEPELSWGFSERVLRRLRDEVRARESSRQFLEAAGRRVVFATLFLGLTLLMAMVLPASGPVRHHTTVHYWPQTEAAASESSLLPVGNFPPVPAVVETSFTLHAPRR